MIYSKFTKTWIKTCDLCGIALIDYEKLFKNVNHNKWDIQFLKKYCIIEKKSYKKNNWGYCLNSRCEAYKLKPIADGVWFDPTPYED